MIQRVAETCTTAIASCTIGAWMLEILLPGVVIALSITWLSLQISWFIWLRYKEWRKNR